MCCTLSNYADGREIINESEPVEETPPIIQNIGLKEYFLL